MQEKGIDFSQFKSFRASGEIAKDTLHHPDATKPHHARFISAYALLEKTGSIYERTTAPFIERLPKKDGKSFQVTMRELMDGYFKDVLDNPEVPVTEKLFSRSDTLSRLELLGTKDPNEYLPSKMKRVDKKFLAEENGPLSYFEKHPPLICQVPFKDARTGEKTYKNLILRGHHEVRRAGNWKLTYIPCEVTTPQALADALDVFNSDPHSGRITPQSITTFLLGQMEIAQRSFAEMRDKKL